jgi:cytochrome c oxidase assembly protein subunit 15
VLNLNDVVSPVLLPAGDSRTMWRPSPAQFRWIALADFISMILIMLSGAAVRLSGSGLGCPDWPTCLRHQITGTNGYHSIIEYGNRLITGVLVVLTIFSLIAACLRIPYRKDLVVLSAALVVGLFANALLGALVVYSKLNPWLVNLHLILSLVMVVLGATLYHHSKYRYGPGENALVRDPHFKRIARLTWIPLLVVIYAGTVTTGAGPHAGGSQGQLVAQRLPIAFSQAAWIHSVAAMSFVMLVCGLLVAVWKTSAPLPLQLGVRRLAVISALQAVIGFTQYWTHVPVLLVELHILGATSVTIAVTQFNLRQISREREPGTKRAT